MKVYRILLVLLLALASFSLISQDDRVESDTTAKKSTLRFQFDSRRTFVDRRTASITGVRLGVALQDKIQVGIGGYSSNLFGLLGNSVTKDYQDFSLDQAPVLSTEIGFHYFSAFGEYTIVNNETLIWTANSQFGIGWVDIDFVEPGIERPSKSEGKVLVEHSIKANVQTFPWLRLIGGVGYRYLLNGDRQIKDAFNAPIYIVGFSIDYKYIYGKLFKKKK